MNLIHLLTVFYLTIPTHTTSGVPCEVGIGPDSIRTVQLWGRPWSLGGPTTLLASQSVPPVREGTRDTLRYTQRPRTGWWLYHVVVIDAAGNPSCGSNMVPRYSW